MCTGCKLRSTFVFSPLTLAHVCLYRLLPTHLLLADYCWWNPILADSWIFDDDPSSSLITPKIYPQIPWGIPSVIFFFQKNLQALLQESPPSVSLGSPQRITVGNLPGTSSGKPSSNTPKISSAIPSRTLSHVNSKDLFENCSKGSRNSPELQKFLRIAQQFHLWFV